MPHGNSLANQNDRESPIVRAVRKVSPAVVNISSSYEVRKRANPFSGFGFDPFFDNFFRDFFDPRFERRRKSTSLGSGVIIDGKRGFILTNAHVIERAGTIKIVLQDEHLMIGETVIAIGNPFGFSHTVTTGVISAANRSIRTEDRVFHDFIQIDASINPGNSGGPLLNINGELIGINTAIYAKAQGIGFAIPISKAKKIISDLIQFGEVIQAWIGLTVQNLNTKLAQYLNYSEKKGVIVKAVESKSPAHKAGLKEGDIIVSIGNKKVDSVRDYRSVKKTYAAGDTLKAKIWRNGNIKAVSVKTEVFPVELAEELAFQLLGIEVENLTAQNRRYYKTPASRGVVISEVDQRSHLANIGARPGDVIRKMDDYPIENNEDFKKAIIKYRQKNSVVLLLQRGEHGYYITVDMR
jgi:S1-C subfamily serine protease